MYTLDTGNNYFYMQVLQGNKQLPQNVAPKRAEFLDFGHSVRQTFHKKITHRDVHKQTRGL